MITIKTLSPNLPFLPRFTLLPSVPQWCRRTGNGQLRVRSWSVCNISSASFLSSLLPCSSMGFAPRDTGSHKLLRSGSSSCWGGPSERDFWHGSPVGHGSCSLGCSFLQDFSIHLLSVGAALACSTASCS